MGTELTPAENSAYPDRRTEIEHIMRTDIARYERDGLRREYNALVETDIEEANPDALDPTRSMPADVSRSALMQTPEGRRLVEFWESTGNFQVQLQNAQKAARSIVSQLGDRREQRAFLERFNRNVPEPARLAIYADLAFGRPTFVRPAEPADIEHFSTEAVGRELVAAWGSKAAEYVAVILNRMDRIWDTLQEDDALALADWFDGLADRDAKQLVAALAN